MYRLRYIVTVIVTVNWIIIFLLKVTTVSPTESTENKANYVLAYCIASSNRN